MGLLSEILTAGGVSLGLLGVSPEKHPLQKEKTQVFLNPPWSQTASSLPSLGHPFSMGESTLFRFCDGNRSQSHNPPSKKLDPPMAKWIHDLILSESQPPTAHCLPLQVASLAICFSWRRSSRSKSQDSNPTATLTYQELHKYRCAFLLDARGFNC